MKKYPIAIALLALIFFGCDSARDTNSPVTYRGSEFDGDIPGGVAGVGDKFTDYGENPFIKTNEKTVSTFSIDADGASYVIMRKYVSQGRSFPKEAVRIEEFINYFTFDYPEPDEGSVSLNTETSDCPWKEGHKLLRIGLKGKSIPESMLPKSNFVFLIDVSGSMKSRDKLELLKEGFKIFTDRMTAEDRIAIVTYAGSDKVVLQSTPGSEKDKIKAAIDKLRSGGSTAGASGIRTAYKSAGENFIPEANNRVILGTDGDFNVGISSKDELVKLIEDERDGGIYLTVLGVGTGNLNDAMMEQLADNGNGTYEYIDNTEQLQKVFVYEAAKFHAMAKDCKIQVVFNPFTVESYRLIGYENRVMDNKDFRNDSADAGEIGASQTITALYEIEPKIYNQYNQPYYATVEMRYMDTDAGVIREFKHHLLPDRNTFSASSENMRFAAAVAGYGMLLKGSAYKGNLTKSDIINWASGAMSFDPHGFRNEFLGIISR